MISRQLQFGVGIPDMGVSFFGAYPFLGWFKEIPKRNRKLGFAYSETNPHVVGDEKFRVACGELPGPQQLEELAVLGSHLVSFNRHFIAWICW